jgi:dolichol-phosphate mannosyltransferase
MTEPFPRIQVTLPTYNEAGNIESLARALLALRRDLGIIVIDDDSPDGTWRIAERLAAEFPGRILLLHRRGERGRGSAGVAGFRKAIELGAEYIVEMDADWSHDPRFLPALLDAAMGGGEHGEGAQEGQRGGPGADVVIGSRLVRGGGERGRSLLRTLITHAANFYIRLLLRLPARDCTTGYRVFRRWVLEGIAWDRVESNGPAIVQEVLLACRAQKARIVEVPILFEPRRAGHSTFNTRIMLAGLAAVARFSLRRPPLRETL